MAHCSVRDIQQMGALFELISEVETLAHSLLLMMLVSLDEHKNEHQQLDIKGDYGEALTLVLIKAQDPSIVTRDRIRPLPKDMPDYPRLKRDMDLMIDALVIFFMTAHNFLVAADTVQAPDTNTRGATTQEDVVLPWSPRPTLTLGIDQVRDTVTSNSFIE